METISLVVVMVKDAGTGWGSNLGKEVRRVNSRTRRGIQQETTAWFKNCNLAHSG